MAIDYVPIGSESGQARSSTQEGDWSRNYVQHWRAITDNPSIGAAEVRTNAPVALGQTYATSTESDPGSYCQRVVAVEDTSANDGCQWIVSAEYAGRNIMQTAPEVPTTQRPKLSFGWADFQKPLVKDANGDPILNSAGDPFNPPLMGDDAWPLMRITRNEPGFNLNLVAQCKGKISNGPWFGFPAKWWKCTNITGDEGEDPDGSIYYAMVYEFALNPNEWTEEALDVGMNEIDQSGRKVKILDSKGQFVSEPWPLNEDGTKKAAGEPGEFIVIETHEAIDFSVFDLDSFYAEEVAAGRLL